MAGAIYQLLYRSFATEDFDTSSIAGILDVSAKNNGYSNITGMLFYSNGIFMQLIEGDKDRLYYLYDKISKDPRHENLRIFWEGKVEERSFPDWSMGFRNLDQVDSEFLQTYDHLLNNAFHTNPLNFNPSTGLKLFTGLKESF